MSPNVRKLQRIIYISTTSEEQLFVYVQEVFVNTNVFSLFLIIFFIFLLNLYFLTCSSFVLQIKNTIFKEK